MRNIDLSSWQSLLTGILGLALVTLIGLGIRVLFTMTLQQRQQRLNRQINERLKTLIAAYKVLGGSFTGNLSVDPAHRRELRPAGDDAPDEAAPDKDADSIGERRRRIRDAVEASLSDIILLGTQEQVRLAAGAAADLAAGRAVQTAALVVSLRDFIRTALDLEAIPGDVAIPTQGPTRPSSSGSGGRGRQAGGAGEGSREGGGGGGIGGGMGGMGGGGVGMGAGIGPAQADDVQPPGRKS